VNPYTDKPGKGGHTGAPETIMTPFVVRGGFLWAFQNLRDEHGPFAHAVASAEAE
jgi:hypothetical protein